MEWKALDYDCRNLFVSELKAIIEEPKRYGYSLFFHHVKEYLGMQDKLSPEIVTILNKANEIELDAPNHEILNKIVEIYKRFANLKM